MPDDLRSGRACPRKSDDRSPARCRSDRSGTRPRARPYTRASTRAKRAASVASCLACLLFAAEVEAAPPSVADRWTKLDPRPANHVSVRALTLSEFAGVDIGYRRALNHHFSLGVALEYVYPDAGYGQIQAFGHTVELAAWIARPWTGPYFAASFVVGHNYVFSVPELSSVAIGGGADFGWSWDLPYHINLGVAVGLRRLVPVARAGPLCSLRRQCVYLLDEFQPHFALSFGYRF